MSEKPKKRAFVAPSRMLRNIFFTLATGLILVALQTDPFSALGESLLLIPFVIAISIAAHEFGHLFAAVLVRFRPAILVLGNLWVRFVGPRPRVGLSSAFMVGGYVVVSPIRAPSKFAFILFFLGGAIANLAMVVAPFGLLIVIALLAPANATAILEGGIPIVMLFAIYNLFLLPFALIPRVFSGFLTDGGYVRETVRNPSYANALADAMKLGCQQFEGIRPRDWDRGLCARLLESRALHTDPLYILMLAHYIEVDTGDFAKAEELLVEAAPLREGVKTLSVESFNVESAFFYGFYKPDSSLCQQYIDECTLLDLRPETRDRLEAALAYSKGEFDKAQRYGKLMLDGLRPPMSPGLDKYIRDSMEYLIRECENRTATTVVQSE